MQGTPTAMPEEWMDKAVADVLDGLNEERSRTRIGFNTSYLPDQPAGPQGECGSRMRDPDSLCTATTGDFGSIWRMLPALKDIPNERFPD